MSHKSEAIFIKPLDLHIETLSQHLKNPEHSMGKEGLSLDQTLISYMPQHRFYDFSRAQVGSELL